MLTAQLHTTCSHAPSTNSPLLGCHRALPPGHWAAGSLLIARVRPLVGRVGSTRNGAGRICCASNEAPTVAQTAESTTKVKAVVTVKLTVGGILTNVAFSRWLDDITDLLGKSLFLELLSNELDPETSVEKKAVGSFVHKAKRKEDTQSYEGELAVPKGFGEIGALRVTNEHRKEMFLLDVVLSGYGDGPLNFHCHSWLHAKSDDPKKRVFFSNKSYLPSQTPNGLQRLREEELRTLRGDGQGERKSFERIYDYDVYNDLGDPDSNDDLARPVLGGSKNPYPRRCRTGRPKTKKDPLTEKRSASVYVPRDEAFSEVKGLTFSVKTLRSVLDALIPSLETTIIDPKLGFPAFTDIDMLFNEGMPPPPQQGFFRTVLLRLVQAITDGRDNVLLFEKPAMIERDKFSWFRDGEFSRQTLAGVNPMSIQLVTEFPFLSELDPEIYGPPESAITKEIVEREMEGMITVEEAVKQKRLFVLDYHDLLLPYVHKVRELEETTLYGSRTLFFLDHCGTLTPIAIELTRPASPTKHQWKQVFTRTSNATDAWLWCLAKCHVAAHDTCYHELVIHWLRTHCCMEPYIIATNRQLSAMHPIYQLLRPHFRYTMEINSMARQALINAAGTIELCFSLLKYSMEFSSVLYDKLWRFDQQALPADLISRGMAVEDPAAEHGLRLTIEDYPFAADGLLIWAAMKQWVDDYVSHYYSDAAAIVSDRELQAWWKEIRTEGHADKKDAPGWPALETPADLVGILTTMMWVASCHHAAVNFGQYHYGGYFPNRPTIARNNMPVEDGWGNEFRRFLEKPEQVMLEGFPSQMQATRVMAVLEVLSNHSVDEEYIGSLPLEIWEGDKAIKAAYERFNGRLMEIEGIIDDRNQNPNLRNRCGAGILPYELLKPFSEPGVTGMGVPNSVSI